MLKSGEPFGFAGLWDTWLSPEGDEIKSCTMITTEANELLRPIHDRMPVILTRETAAPWLDPAIQDSATLLPLLRPHYAEAIEAYPVSRWVNTSDHDTPTCIEPLRESPYPASTG